MVKKLCVLFCGVFTLMNCNNLEAQTTAVNLSYVNSSVVNACSIPAVVRCSYYGSADDYNAVTDLMSIDIFWGDGNDTTFTIGLTEAGLTDFFDTTGAGTISHTYQMPGTFIPMVVTTGIDMVDDTLVGNALVLSTSCTTVDGYVYTDNNSNNVFDSGDDTLAGALVQVKNSSGVIIYSALTDAHGHYLMDVATGLSSLQIAAVPGMYFSPTFPAGGSYSFSSTTSASFNFALDCTGSSPDFYAYHTGMCGIGAPGGNGQMAISAGVTGCATLVPATVTLTIDPSVHFVSMVSGPLPTSIVGNVFTWNVTLSSYTGYSSGPSFNATMITYTDTTVAVGSPSCFDIAISSPITETDTTNNGQSICLIVDGPWDPNSKEVVPAGVGPTGDVMPDTDFYYLINFQNTGNMPAVNIKVLDTLSNNLDLATLQILGSSHYMEPMFTGANIVWFKFPDINLPDSVHNEPASHGWVKYRIKAKSGLANGSQIKNTGYIYFDYNPAVVTNSALNTINPFLNVNEVSTVMTNTLYPNPANTSITLQFGQTVSGKLYIIDMTGKVVKQVNANSVNQLQIAVNDLAPGIYSIALPGVSLKQNRFQVIK
jgi:hypothetical protein